MKMNSIRHSMLEANSARFHVAETGKGRPLLLLHGWPEFWFTWEPVMTRLADRFRLIAPDLRGFGDSDKPPGPFAPHDHASDLLELLNQLAIERIGVVGHDVGGAAMQPLARLAPDRFPGLFFFDFPYPGMGAPDSLIEIWYQSFNQMPMAPALVGSSRETCKAYFGHFLRHWSWRKDTFNDVLDVFVDNFLKPGNLEGGFAHYKATHASRIAMMKGEAPKLPQIAIPACVRWAEHDPVLPFAWADHLSETFAKLDFAQFPDIGHFPHREDPDRAAEEISRSFTRLDWGERAAAQPSHRQRLARARLSDEDLDCHWWRPELTHPFFIQPASRQ